MSITLTIRGADLRRMLALENTIEQALDDLQAELEK